MKKFILLLTIFLITSCVSTAPEKNSSFGKVLDINQLVGNYKNKGDGGPDKNNPLFLSKVLWPNAENINHGDIIKIEVSKVSDAALIVRAFTNNKIIKESTFTLGKEFELKNGVITLSQEARIAGFKSGDPMLGVYAGGSKIGLDQEGNGKFYSGGSAAGLVFMFLPMVFSGSEEVRFERLEQ